MNRGASRRGRSGRLDVGFHQLVVADPAAVVRLARSLGVFQVEPHYDRCRRIIRWYKRNPQPRRTS